MDPGFCLPVNSVSTCYSGWAGLAEESPWLERPRSFADLLSHADKIDPQDAELRQLYALLSAAIPEAIPGRQCGQILFF
jgi:hypothetical protein